MGVELGLAFVTGVRAGGVVPLAGDWVIGTDDAADLQLTASAVSPKHASLRDPGTGYRLLDLGSANGTFLNGLRLPPGEEVVLPPQGCVLQFGEGGPMAVADTRGSFQNGTPLALRREDTGVAWPLAMPLHIGRSRTCEVRLDPELDSVASSRHVRVLSAFGMAIVIDLGSANGTFLENGMRILQTIVRPGGRVQLGGQGGPWFRIEEAMANTPPPEPATDPVAPPRGEPIPECFNVLVSSGELKARIQVACKPEVQFGSFAGLCDFETACFPRELESEQDAQTRSESIGPQHGTFELTRDGVELVVGQMGATKLNGTALFAGTRGELGAVFDVSLGEDVLGLRGRIFKHPRLAPRTPKVGGKAKHPVECVVLERKGDGDETLESRLYLQLVRQASIGSADDSAIRLPFPGVAPLHASLFLRNDCLWITQLGEQPVAVDGQPMQQGATRHLRVGSVIYVGATKFVIEE